MKSIITAFLLSLLVFPTFGEVEKSAEIVKSKELTAVPSAIEISTTMNIQEVVKELSKIGVKSRPRKPGELSGMYFEITDRRILRVDYNQDDKSINCFCLKRRPPKGYRGEGVTTNQRLYALKISKERSIIETTHLSRKLKY